MHSKAAITVNRPVEEVKALWGSSGYRPTYIENADTAVSFVAAPGDRGTEIHVDLLKDTPGGKIGELVAKLTDSLPRAKVKDDLRRFKAYVETGEVPRSDSTPEGEKVERKLKQRPAQPLSDDERQEVGV
jgi:uncharacterized membrane protein